MSSVRSAAACASTAALLLVCAAAPSAPAQVTIDEATHKVETPSLRIAFDDDNPEQVNTLRWGSLGETDLASGGGSACGDETESWGEAYGDPGPPYVAEVAAGSRGQWRDVGDHQLVIDSQITDPGCSGDPAVSQGEDPVRTTYRFYDHGPRLHQIAVTRRFGFGPEPTAFTVGHLRPYTPRMPSSLYSETLWPKGGALQTTPVSGCGTPCPGDGWDKTWYAQNDPVSEPGFGLLVLRDPASVAANPARLVIDSDTASASNNSSADLIEPVLPGGNGWIKPVVETEYLCFYTKDTWTPQERAAARPPSWCGPAPTPQLSITSATVSESAGSATLTVTRSDLDAPMPSFDVDTVAGTATSPTDYGVAAAGVFATGASTATVTVPILNDITHEETESFTVALTDVIGATVAGPATVTITDDDAAPPPPGPGTTSPTLSPGSTGTGSGPVGSTGSTTPKPKPLKAADYITLPSAKKCVSQRSFRIRLKQPKGVKIKSATVKVNGKLVKTIKGKRVTAPVDLRGLPKGKFTVAIVVTTTAGKTVKASHTYKTCASKARR